MQNSALFSGFSDAERQKMLKCLGAKIKKCNTNETIMSHSENSDYLYVVLSGYAELISYDYDGNKYILESFAPDSVFGDMFFKPTGNDEFLITATSPCTVLSFRYKSAIAQCEKTCAHHVKLLDNLFRLLSKKLSERAQHIELLSKRTIREKLLTYFEMQSAKNGSFSFLLPMSLSALSDYLSIDRSAMQREIRRLNDEGVIQSKGKRIVLIRK